MLKEEGFGERGGVNGERGVGSDGRGMVFVGVCEEMLPLTPPRPRTPCVH